MAKVPNIIVGDIETGGYVYHKHALTEIALIAIDTVTLEEIDRYEAVIAPYNHKDGTQVEYTPAALQYSGMTMAKIEAGRPAKEVAEELNSFFSSKKKDGIEIHTGGVNGKPVLCGHNFWKFDKPFIDYFLWLHGKAKLKTTELKGKKDPFAVIEFDTPYNSYVEDSLYWTRWKYANTDIPNHKLATACEYTDVALMDAHRAMNDTEANKELKVEFLKSLRGTGEARIIERVRDEFRFK